MLGIFQMAQDAGAILGPVLVGVVADQAGYEWAFAVTGVVSLVAVLPWLAAPETLVRAATDRPGRASMKSARNRHRDRDRHDGDGTGAVLAVVEERVGDQPVGADGQTARARQRPDQHHDDASSVDARPRPEHRPAEHGQDRHHHVQQLVGEPVGTVQVEQWPQQRK